MVSYLTSALRTRSTSPTVLVIDTTGPGSRWLMPLSFASAVLATLGCLCFGQVGVLHLHIVAGGSMLRKSVLAMLGHALGKPVIIHLHGTGFIEFYDQLPAPGQALVRMVFQRADRILVLGEYWQDFVIRRLRVAYLKTRVVPNGVPDPSPIVTRKIGASCRICFVGEVGERKGVPELLSALAHPRMVHLNWTAVIAGTGEVEKYRQEAAQLGLADRVQFTGWLDEAGVRDLLRHSDIFALPSHSEGSPLALLEAMAHRVAILCTPSIQDAIQHERTGLLVPPGHVPWLANALKRLIQNPGLRVTLQEAAYQVFREKFSIDLHQARIVDIYEELMAAEPVTGGKLRPS
jgi:glycosyltransferase involved in cell wall biosynthesis